LGVSTGVFSISEPAPSLSSDSSIARDASSSTSSKAPPAALKVGLAGFKERSGASSSSSALSMLNYGELQSNWLGDEGEVRVNPRSDGRQVRV
jgi:hypothetical protein